MTRYTFITATKELRVIEAETIEQAYEAIKAEFGGYLKVVKREKIK